MLSPDLELPAKPPDPVEKKQPLLAVEELVVEAVGSFAEDGPQPLGVQGSGFVRWVR